MADLSSIILAEPLDVSKFGLIYACAQKNIGPAGLTIVIVRDDLIGKAQSGIPALMDYAAQAKNGSMINTPPTFGIYLAGLIFKNLKAQGGLPAIEVHNHIRGLSPFPGAWTEIEVGGKPERVKLLASHLVQGEGTLAAPGTAVDDHLTIACGKGAVSLVRLQKAGGKALSAEDFLRGTPLPKGTVIA